MTDDRPLALDAPGGTPAREVALDCVAAGIEAARPERVIRDAVSLDGDRLRVTTPGTDSDSGGTTATYDLGAYDRVIVLGGGKAAAGVAAALEGVLGDALDGGLVVTDTPVETEVVTVREGDHPVPTERNAAATRELLARARDADERTLVLAVLTGGASALLAAPADGIDLGALRETTEALLDSGAAIDEMNAARKHLSAVKGGQLARAAAPARVVTLALSDVVGNDLSVIGSGPTVPDPSTYADALAVLDRFDIAVPDAVREHLESGAAGEIPETPKPGDAVFDRASAHVVADGYTALAAASESVPEEYAVCVLSSRFEGEARDLASPHVAVAAECAATGNPVPTPAVLLSGGEATVTVRGDGTGGPSQELALRAAIELDAVPGVGGTEAGADSLDETGEREVVVAAVDTDGRDGATDAAGALVDATTVAPGDREAARDALADNDAYPFLDARDALVHTGRTGTNVNDLRVVVVA